MKIYKLILVYKDYDGCYEDEKLFSTLEKLEKYKENYKLGIVNDHGFGYTELIEINIKEIEID